MPLTLKQARVINEISQHKMAEMLGIHVDTYRKIEREPDMATIEQARKISKITGVPVEQIFFAQ